MTSQSAVWAERSLCHQKKYKNAKISTLLEFSRENEVTFKKLRGSAKNKNKCENFASELNGIEK